LDIVETLKVNKLVDIVRFCESINETLLMLPNAPRKVVCDTNVKGSVLSTGEDVDEEGLAIIHVPILIVDGPSEQAQG